VSKKSKNGGKVPTVSLVEIAAKIIGALDNLELPEKSYSAVRVAAEHIADGKHEPALLSRMVSALAVGNESAQALASEAKTLMTRATPADDAAEDEPEVLPPEPLVPVSKITRTGTSEVDLEQYREALTATLKLVADHTRDLLRCRWHMGKIAAELVPAGSTGQQWAKFFDRFAEDLGRIGGLPMSAGSIRECRRFYLDFNKEQLERAVDANLSVRNSLLLCGVDDHVRDTVISQVKGKRINQNDVRRMIHIAEGNVDEAKNVDVMDSVESDLRDLRSMRRAIEQLCTRVDTWTAAFEMVSQNGAADAKQRAQDEQALALKAMEQLVEAWQAQVDLVVADG
jgi:hypothetical protein